MLRFGLLMLPFILSGCTSPGTNSIADRVVTDKAGMIFVPPVEAHETAAPETPAPKTTAQETTECIQLHQVRSTRVIDRIGIAYEMPNRKVWLNRPKWGASMLKEYLVMVTRGDRNTLCSGDIVRFMDSSPVGFLGAVALGPFVRYSNNE